jgi:hypothetical protein
VESLRVQLGRDVWRALSSAPLTTDTARPHAHSTRASKASPPFRTRRKTRPPPSDTGRLKDPACPIPLIRDRGKSWTQNAAAARRRQFRHRQADIPALIRCTVPVPSQERPRSCGRWSAARMASPSSMRSTAATGPATRSCTHSTCWSTMPLGDRKAKLARLLARKPAGVVLSTSTPTRTAPRCSGTPASLGSRASCRSGSARPTGPARRGTGSRSRTQTARRCDRCAKGGGEGAHRAGRCPHAAGPAPSPPAHTQDLSTMAVHRFGCGIATPPQASCRRVRGDTDFAAFEILIQLHQRLPRWV